MSEETVTVGDTEVQIEETEDGFEAVPVEDSEDSTGIFLRATSNSGRYGFEIPLDGSYEIERNSYTDYDKYDAVWDTSEDVSDLKSDGIPDSLGHGSWDGRACVNKPEIVVR